MDISVVILTYNESLHIKRCITNVQAIVQDVFVVDCFSSDGTVEMAKELGAHVFQNKWEGLYARQFNWALDNLPIKTKWVLRLDADEYLSQELIAEIQHTLCLLPNDVTGVFFYLRRVFMGRDIRRGMPRIRLLRLFQYGKARCEQRMMDEHIVLFEGHAVVFAGDFSDHNLNDIGWWTAKHNGYALREAVDILNMENGLLDGLGHQPNYIGAQAAQKRVKKARYARMPLFWRAFAYFLYRYFLRGGFLEGSEGFLWHFLQGWWYRTLVDAKIFEIKRASGGEREKMLILLREKYGMKL